MFNCLRQKCVFIIKVPKQICSYFSCPSLKYLQLNFFLYFMRSPQTIQFGHLVYDCLILIWQQIKFPFFISYVHPHFTIHNNIMKRATSNSNEGNQKKRLITQWTGHFLRRAEEREREKKKMFNQKSRFIFCWLIWFRYVSAYFFFLFYCFIPSRSLCFFLCIHTYSVLFYFIMYFFSGHPFKAWT